MPLEYPSYLPLALLSPKTYQTGETMIRTERLKGLARNRRWTSSPAVVAQVEWLIEGPKAELFQAWHSEILADGVEWFEMPVLYAGYLAPRRCRFTGMYSGPNPVNTRYVKFTAELEIFKRPLIDPGWLAMPEYWYNLETRSIFDQAMNREWPTP